MKIKIVLMTWELVHVEGYVPVEQRERERGGGGEMERGRGRERERQTGGKADWRENLMLSM